MRTTLTRDDDNLENWKQISEVAKLTRELEPFRPVVISSTYLRAKKKYDELRQHCADLEERLRVYAAAVNLLALENAALTGREPDAHVIPLPRAQATLGPHERHNR